MKYSWSEQRDSNSRPFGPKPNALPGCAMLRIKIKKLVMHSEIWLVNQLRINLFLSFSDYSGKMK